MLAFKSRILSLLQFYIFASTYVYNGDDSPPGLYRWFVHMYGCGGALISSNVVLTATHCVEKLTSAGEWKGEVLTRGVNKYSWWWQGDGNRPDTYLRRFPLHAQKIHTVLHSPNSSMVPSDWALILLKEDYSVCDDRFGPLALLLPFEEGEEPEKLIKADRNHQCLQAGYGQQVHNKKITWGSARMKQMRQWRINYAKFNAAKDAPVPITLFGNSGTHLCPGDSGSPYFCIVNDYPIMVTLASVSTIPKVIKEETAVYCGRKDVIGGGPHIYNLRKEMEKVLSDLNQLDAVRKDQKKCRNYYKEHGFLNEYVDRVKNQLYPKDKNITIDTDNYHYPSVDSIDMDGSYRTGEEGKNKENEKKINGSWNIMDVDFFLDEDLDHEVLNIALPRVIQDRMNPLENYTEEQFRVRYRFGKEAFVSLVRRMDDFHSPRECSSALSNCQKLAIFCSVLAQANFQIVTGDLIGCDKSTVSRIMTELSSYFTTHSGDFIKWPSAQEQEQIAARYFARSNIPNVIGSIDGSHVRIMRPVVQEEQFINRKGYHSINIGAVVDDQRRFRWINTRYPGRCHDSKIFKESRLYADLQAGRKSGTIVGDSAYAVETFLLKPVLGNNRTQRGLYRWFVHLYGCGGAMISSRVVLTATHCVNMLDLSHNFKAEILPRGVNKLNGWWEGVGNNPETYRRRFPLHAKEISFTFTKKDKFRMDTDWALVLLKEDYSVCDDRFGPLALLLPFEEGEEPEKLIKADRNHQCLQAGYGQQRHNDSRPEGSAARFMQMRQWRINYALFHKAEDDPNRTVIEMLGNPRTHMCPGDSGSPMFCIVNDYPIMVSLASAIGYRDGSTPTREPHCGHKDIVGLGPHINQLRWDIENALSEWKQTEAVRKDQNKCRNYYKQHGFLKEYVDRVKNQLYPKDKNITIDTDNYHYPSVDSIDMDGSYRTGEEEKNKDNEKNINSSPITNYLILSLSMVVFLISVQ